MSTTIDTTGTLRSAKDMAPRKPPAHNSPQLSAGPTRGGVRATGTSLSSRRDDAAGTAMTTEETGNAEGKGSSSTMMAAAHLLSLGQLDFVPKLDFVATNRVVAVVEKAVERLQLLSLLDATGPSADAEEGRAAAAAAARRAADADNITANMIGTRRTGTTRGAATFEGSQHAAAMRKTAPAVTAALMAIANTEGRGRATVAELLGDQQRLERRYGELLQETKKVRAPATEPSLDPQCFTATRNPQQAALLHELKLVSAKLREHNKILCTQLKDNPNDADNWNKISNERKELITLLQGTIAELTTGYQEARRSKHDGTGNTQDSYKKGNPSFNSTLKRTSSARSVTSNHNRPSPTGAASETDSQSTAPLLRRFGSTQQMRKTAKESAPSSRIPLTSTYDRFARKIVQEQAAQRWADALVKKEKELNQNVKQLQSDLLMERGMKERELAGRRERAGQLRVQLRELKRRLKERSDEAKAQVEAATEGLQRQAADEDREVTEGMLRNQQLLQSEDRAFDLFANHLKERAGVMDSLAAEWDRKNQLEIKRMEMGRIDAEQTRQQCSERLTECQNEEVTQLEHKEERDLQKKAEEDALLAAEKKRQDEYLAASTLESAIKAMFSRQAIAKLKKGSKKGSKKKKSE